MAKGAIVPTTPMLRRHRLRRVVLLCCAFARNLAYYRAMWEERYQDLLELEMGESANFWRITNNNCLDMSVLEWCKLFADKRGAHHWSKIVTDPDRFNQK